MQTNDNQSSNGIILDARFATKNGAKNFHSIAKSELMRNITDPATRYLAGKNIEEGARGLKQDVIEPEFIESLAALFPEQYINGKEFIYNGIRYRFLRPDYADNWDYSDDEEYEKNRLLLEKKENEVRSLRQILSGIKAADRQNGKGREKRPFAELKVIIACHGPADIIEYEDTDEQFGNE